MQNQRTKEMLELTETAPKSVTANDEFEFLLRRCVDTAPNKKVKNVYAHAINVLRLNGRAKAEEYLALKKVVVK